MSSLSFYGSLYEKLASALKHEKWFKSHWQAKGGLYPNAESPKSAFIQVFKDSWFNEEGKGIHFESWMTNADVSRGTTCVVLHIESSKERTGINGKALVKNLLTAVGEKIGSWDGYQIKESYTMQPFIRKMNITAENHIKTLSAEFTRLSFIGGAIDEAIAEAQK